MKRTLGVVALLSVVFGATAGHAGRRVVSSVYTGSPNDRGSGPSGSTCYMLNSQACVGGRTYDLDGTEGSVSVVIDDWSLSPNVGAVWSLDSADGTSLASGSLCGSAFDIDVPAGASWLEVFVDGPLAANGDDCGFATAGTITAIFETR